MIIARVLKNHHAASIAGTRAIVTSNMMLRVDIALLICGLGETVIFLSI